MQFLFFFLKPWVNCIITHTYLVFFSLVQISTASRRYQRGWWRVRGTPVAIRKRQRGRMRDRLAVTGTERLGFDTSQHSHSSQHSQKLFFFLHQQRVLVELCTDPETIGENSSISKSYGRNNFEALTSHTRSVGASTERSSKLFFSSTVEYRMVPIEILVGY